ncbi:hypothetical protein E2H86_08620 [Pseudomonas putida]|uniref:pyocin knob domain-containing protein n=1 Tax=Pseudomonas putida TaxID=303 RepID=UPI001059A438|nr:pyocin knob domain-containing protein [Pseudomonas putida]TDJ77235.1 hypothetical protein E2H86_08620 [Pseudomonas putida]
MPWYRTGTVAITAGQTTVTGTGTAFALNARVGDAFQGPDGRWYEVTNIASATVLSILPAYQGATVSGGAYGLAPMQGYVKESADRLRQLVDQFGATLSLFGGATTVASLLQNISAATRGANSDITSLSGMTTALSIAQGGTGSKTAAGAVAALGLTLPTASGGDTTTDFNTLITPGWQPKLYQQNNPNSPGALGGAAYYYVFTVVYSSNLTQIAIPYGSNAANRGRICIRSLYQGTWLEWQRCLSQYDILGTVSQSGGVATGAVIERGSNANGEYIKFADGTMICQSAGRSLNFVNTSNLNSSWAFPVGFATVPVVSVNLVSSTLPTQRQITMVGAYSRSVNTATCAVLSIGQFVAADASTGLVDCIAIGRWY